ncbi:MAG: [Fe-Fe] hydrogenase large subunit C-terminal domain-containing protein [Bacteroidales bacterium]|nr:[Fe-Fe] hydrogenase large subunit C-terminal domain-containing protein [Bacteroidales bacterium]
MEPIIYIDQDKCTDSYSCIRVCPVKAIEVKAGNQHPAIIPDRCIGCGLCFIACSAGAVRFRDSTEETLKLLRNGKKNIALVAPSIASEFDDITDYRKLVAMVRQLGFDHVHEVSFGVDIIAALYRDLFESARGKYYITSNCPVIVKMIEKYYPGLASNLAPLVSPMVATGMIAREKYGEATNLIYIGPCIDSKDEALSGKGKGTIDSVLTFIELRKLFEEAGIEEKKVKNSDFDPPYGNYGALFPIPSGIIYAAGIKRDVMESGIITASGKDDISEAVKDFHSHIDIIKHHFNLFFCQGCLLGPGMDHHNERYRRRNLVRLYTDKRLKELDREQWEKDMKKWSVLDYSRKFRADDQRIPEPPESAINEVLRIIGRTGDRIEDNCGACGYESCRDFAVTVAMGLTIPEMCHKYNIRNKQEYIEKLRITNKKLSETQKALRESETQARREKELTQEASETVNSMLEKLPSAVVIVDQNLKIIHSNKSFINIAGEDAVNISEIIPGLKGADLKSILPFNVYNMFTYALRQDESVVNRDIRFNETMLNISVFPISKGKIAGAVLRDMFSPEVQREEIIMRINDVIEKNLDMVQKIGFLLGEGASETEKMLNSILESYRKNKEDNKTQN